MERPISKLERVARELWMDLSLPWQESPKMRRKYDADFAVESIVGDAKVQFYRVEAEHLAFRIGSRKIAASSHWGNYSLGFDVQAQDLARFLPWLAQRTPYGAFLADQPALEWLDAYPIRKDARIRLANFVGIREFFTDLLASQYAAQK